MQLLQDAVGGRTALAWLRAAWAPSAPRATSRRLLGVLLRGVLRRCPSGCFPQAGCTYHTCIRRRCHTLECRMSSGSLAATRMAMGVRTVRKFEGEVFRLGRHWQRRPETMQRPTLVMVLEFVGPA